MQWRMPFRGQGPNEQRDLLQHLLRRPQAQWRVWTDQRHVSAPSVELTEGSETSSTRKCFFPQLPRERRAEHRSRIAVVQQWRAAACSALWQRFTRRDQSKAAPFLRHAVVPTTPYWVQSERQETSFPDVQPITHSCWTRVSIWHPSRLWSTAGTAELADCPHSAHTQG